MNKRFWLWILVSVPMITGPAMANESKYQNLTQMLHDLTYYQLDSGTMGVAIKEITFPEKCVFQFSESSLVAGGKLASQNGFVAPIAEIERFEAVGETVFLYSSSASNPFTRFDGVYLGPDSPIVIGIAKNGGNVKEMTSVYEACENDYCTSKPQKVNNEMFMIPNGAEGKVVRILQDLKTVCAPNS